MTDQDLPETFPMDETHRNYEFLVNRAEMGYEIFHNWPVMASDAAGWDDLPDEVKECWLRIAHAVIYEANEAPKN